jgi:hypothetical protein
LAEGIQISESAMRTPEAFLRALARMPVSGIKITGSADIFSKENLTTASKLLTEYRRKLSDPNSPELRKIWMKGGGEGAVRRRIQMVDSLLAQLRTKGTRVPPSGYGYESGRLPFGTLEGGPGSASGRKPGTSGPASQFRPGRIQRMFNPAEAIMTFARRVLPSDLLDVMISTSQFIKYANYAWPPGRRMREKGVPKKRVALKYLEYLKNASGRLRDMLSPAVISQMGVRGQQLRNDILELWSNMDPLERDLQYGY